MKRQRAIRARTEGARRATGLWQNDRRGRIEVLERRRLLTIDFPAAPIVGQPDTAESAAAQVASPIAQVFYPDGTAEPFSTTSPTGFSPTQVRHAYGLDQILLNGTIVGDGTGQTIAIVDAYDSPTVQSDLKAFDTAFGLPDPPSFTRVAQDGTTNYPVTDPKGKGTNNWEVETALDVEWSHAMAPKASILLVEATDNSFGNLIQTAAAFASRQTGVSVVSMSFGSPEFSGESVLDSVFTTPSGHNGVTYIASTGDTGQPGEYPAYSPNVVAIGGTTLSLDGSNNITAESGWSGSGGGISQFEGQPNFQTGIVTQSSSQRTIPDVSFDANPSSGVSVYDTYNGSTAAPWEQIGGTSLSAPSWAGLIAVANQGRALASLPSLDGHNGTLPGLYAAPSSSFHDIISGNNGFAAGAGYDLVTGRGSPVAPAVVNSLIGNSSISGNVFDDNNGNGTQDANESGLSGWTVYDDTNNNGILDPATQTTVNSTDTPKTIPDRSTVTSSLTVSGLSGAIDDLNVTITIHHSRDSDLAVTLISPDGTSIPLVKNVSGTNFVSTVFDDQAAAAITSNPSSFTGTFRPATPLAGFIGKVPNGVWKLQVTDSVTGISGTLNSWSLQFLDTAEQSVATEPNGNYVFTNVSAGTHNIREVAPVGYTDTSPAGGVHSVTVATGQAVVGQNFGNLPSSVSGTVFSDDNNNGTLDPGETGLAGSNVFDDLNGNGVLDFPAVWGLTATDVPKTIADQTTVLSTMVVSGLTGAILDLNVNLTLHHTNDSDLSVMLMAPDNTIVTLVSHNGGSGANFLGTTFDDQASLAIASGTAPFSNTYKPTSVLSAFNGKNANGVWKLIVADTVAGNSGTLNGWSLQFTTNSTEPATTTAADGSYTLSDLVPGSHQIRQYFTGDEDTLPTAPAGGSYNFTVGGQTTVTGDNFGDHAPSISGTVFNDANQNGTQDPTESGLAGWTVYDDVNNDGIDELATSNNLTSSDVPKAIPDLSTITSTLPVSGIEGSIADITVTLSIQHPSDTDLQITLISPAGTSVTLYENSGAGINMTNTTFDDQSTQLFTGNSAPYTGSFQPFAPLSTFDGEGVSGTWTLQVADTIQFQSGTLLNWSMHIDTAAEPSTVTAADGSYSFTNVTPGTHVIREVVQSGFSETSPAGGAYSLDVDNGAFITGQNFGNVATASSAPGTPVLLAVSDTGSSNHDDLTRLNNSSAGTALQFQVPATIAGATVDLYSDGVLIGSAVASGSTTTVVTDGSTLLSDGAHSITARQIAPGMTLSSASSALAIQIDTVPPTATIAAVTPNPHTSSISQLTITFSEPVSGLSLSNLQLTRDGSGNLLTGQTVTSSDGITWTLSDLTALTSVGGLFELDLNPGVAAIVDAAGNAQTTSASRTFRIDLNAPVVDLNGAAAGSGYTTSWTHSGAVSIADPAAATLVDSDSPSLTSLTVTLATPHAGDVLAANTAGTSIVASFNGTTLTLSGSDTPADYQQVLRTVTYDNTAGGPGVTSQSVSFVASDGTLSSTPAVATIQILDATIAGRELFYNNSKYDGNNTAINAADDAAIDTSKTPYLPGTGAATFASVSSYSRGINGIMVDIAGSHGPITAADFIFKTGNSNSPSTWTTVSAAANVAVRPGAGIGGSDRVEITWADNAIQKTWLEVIVRGDDTAGGSDLTTGLATSNVFFWANALADAGAGDSSGFITNASDELAARNNPAALLNNIPTSNQFDFNRDGRVDSNDQLLARNNGNVALTAPKIINIGSGQFAPDAAPAAITGDAGVGTGLSDVAGANASSAAAQPTRGAVAGASPTSIVAGATDSLHDELARLFGQFSARERSVLGEVERALESAGLEDDVLDLLAARGRLS